MILFFEPNILRYECAESDKLIYCLKVARVDGKVLQLGALIYWFYPDVFHVINEIDSNFVKAYSRAVTVSFIAHDVRPRSVDKNRWDLKRSSLGQEGLLRIEKAIDFAEDIQKYEI